MKECPRHERHVTMRLGRSTVVHRATWRNTFIRGDGHAYAGWLTSCGLMPRTGEIDFVAADGWPTCRNCQGSR